MIIMSDSQMPWQIIVIASFCLLLVCAAIVAPHISKWIERRSEARDGDLNFQFNWRD
jgi:putative effector of murein hydrolase LrgA (UPF0299 family)